MSTNQTNQIQSPTPNETVDTKLTTTVSQVAEIFNAAGFAFKKLSELIHSLDVHQQTRTTAQQNGAGLVDSHWDKEEIVEFRQIVDNFNDGLARLADGLKSKMEKNLKDEHREEALKQLTDEERKALSS